jgi:hypothetical protein
MERCETRGVCLTPFRLYIKIKDRRTSFIATITVYSFLHGGFGVRLHSLVGLKNATPVALPANLHFATLQLGKLLSPNLAENLFGDSFLWKTEAGCCSQ